MNETSKQVSLVRIFAKALKYGGYECRLASMVYKVFDKKTSGSGTKNENISNIELAEELHKPIIA